MSAALFFPFLFLYFFQQVFATSCPKSISCGNFTSDIQYPFYTNISTTDCHGIYLIQCINLTPMIKIPGQDFLYPVFNISYQEQTIILHDLKLSLSPYPWGPDCVFLYDFRYPIRHANVTELSMRISSNAGSLFRCGQKYYDFNQNLFRMFYNSSLCKDYDLYYTYKQRNSGLPSHCSTSGPFYFSWKLSFSKNGSGDMGFSLLSVGFSSSWDLQQECFACGITGSNCSSDGAAGESTCTCGSHCRGGGKTRRALIGVAAGAGGFILASVLCFLWYCNKKRVKHPPSSPLIKISSSDKSYPKEITLGAANYQTHIFSFRELEEATNNFNTSQEIGDGGFGTVYKGKLRDGRTVAVKRLYENNYKRLEQFMNEIAILSHLRHQNLVSLYGCTSHLSRELLLVYEFVPNGTVADHLHGRHAAEKPLSWSLRLNIAIETAEALAYLHAIEPPVIHRDVKTNNILLDNNFHVKVADFGLSRLFPADATHVSTAPQGTPGYLDPEYHQCYQLTDKSDVYSFGVVLVELISSKQAVDIHRHKNEINLASMALSKIQNHQLEQLVDPGLGYQSDCEMERMITLMAELAFRCLQMESDMRPPIREVLEGLKEIESCRTNAEKADVRVMVDTTGLPKSSERFSPNSVMEKWKSTYTTPFASDSSTN